MDVDFTNPGIDWAALSPELILLGGASVVAARALFLPPSAQQAVLRGRRGALPRRGRRAPRSRSSSHDETAGRVVAEAIRRDRLAELGQILVAASGLLTVGVAYCEPGGAGAGRRVLRAPAHGRRRHGLLRRRRQPHDALPRPRVVLDLPLRPDRDRDRPAALARGRAQVPDRRELRLGNPALRERLRLRRRRGDRVRGDRPRRRARPTGSSSSPGSP